MRRLVTIALIILLGYLLWWRWQVAQTRFFDVDEFSYLHWTANIVKGERPYIDFFLIFTPGFLWVFAPLVKAYWMSASVFLAARGLAYLIFLALLAAVSFLFARTRNKRWVLLPAIILAFLPMPYDKFLEVRPDNFATLLGFVALTFESLAFVQKKRVYWFLAGMVYTVSVIVFIKMIPFPFIGVLVALGAWMKREIDARDVRTFILGMVIPGILLLGWMATLGDLGYILYSVLKLPFETNRVGQVDIMEPHLFFFPNASFYGGWGMTLGLITNHFWWVMGLLAGVYRLFTPYITAAGDTRKTYVEYLVGGIFIVSVYGYIQFFPLKHSQYLIPIAVFIAYYSADWLSALFEWVERRSPWLFLCILLAGSFVLAQATITVNRMKLVASNSPQLAHMEQLLKTVPANARVFDLEGKMLFWEDAYYICCVSVGSFVHYISRPPAPLISALSAETEYIFQGESNRLSALSPSERLHIATYYEPVPGWGDMLLVRK